MLIIGIGEATARYFKEEKIKHEIKPKNFKDKTVSLKEARVKAYTQPMIQKLIVEYYKKENAR